MTDTCICTREEMIYAMEPILRLKRSPTGVGLEPGTARSRTTEAPLLCARAPVLLSSLG